MSVVVPLYNKRATIRRCLESILEQSVSNLEVVVVDDGSTDGSGDVVREFTDPRLRLVSQSNRGESGARNRGIAEASGDLIAFLDADDCWLPGFLEAIVALRRRYPGAGLYATGVGRCWCDGRPDLLTFVRADTGVLVRDYFRAVRNGDFVSSSSVAVPKAVLEEVGGFAVGQPWGADRDLWVRVAVRYPVACDPRVLAFYFTPPERDLKRYLAAAPIVPVATRHILALIESGQAPEALRESLRNYVDWSVLQAADENLWAMDRDRLRRLLAEVSGLTTEGKRNLRLYRLLSRGLPLQLFRAVRWKVPKALRMLRLLRTEANGEPSFLAREKVPCTHPKPAGA